MSTVTKLRAEDTASADVSPLAKLRVPFPPNQMTGFQWYGCGEGDDYTRGFTADAPQTARG